MKKTFLLHQLVHEAYQDEALRCRTAHNFHPLLLSFSMASGTRPTQLSRAGANESLVCTGAAKSRSRSRRVEAKTTQDRQKSVTSEAQISRENEESRTNAAAMTAEATATADFEIPTDQEDMVGEIPQAAFLANIKYPGLPRAEIARISTKKFRWQNLCKLCHLQGREDKDREEIIMIQSGRMKLEKVTGSNRDFGTTWDIWSEAFLQPPSNNDEFSYDRFPPGSSGPPSFPTKYLAFHRTFRTVLRLEGPAEDRWSGPIRAYEKRASHDIRQIFCQKWPKHISTAQFCSPTIPCAIDEDQKEDEQRGREGHRCSRDQRYHISADPPRRKGGKTSTGKKDWIMFLSRTDAVLPREE